MANTPPYFFNESEARRLGNQEILIGGLEILSFKKSNSGNITLNLQLPENNQEVYTNTRQGRLMLEKQGEFQSLRSSAGGLVYTKDDCLILQSKFYPKSGDRYFSPFGGLSSSFEDIKKPKKIASREGVEEFLAYDSETNTIFIPDLSATSFFSGVCTREQLKKLTKQLPNTKYQMVESEVSGNGDILTLSNSKSRLISKTDCILDVNFKSNSFDMLKLCNLSNLPNQIHFYETEFNCNVVEIPFQQLREMWENWKDPIKVKSYLSTGEIKEIEYSGLFDTLVQRVAMKKDIIPQQETRTDYKQYSENSIYS